MGQMKEIATDIELCAPAKIERDRDDGSPMIVPVAPGKPVRYARCSSLDIISDPSKFEMWAFKRLVDGAVARPDLLALWPELAGHNDQVSVVNELRRAGGAWTKADRGTAFHDTFANLYLNGIAPPSEFAAGCTNLMAALDALGFTIVAVERFVVDDERRIAGTFDVLVRDRNGVHFIVDIKTGSLHPIAASMQCLAYARAPYYFTKGHATDGTDDVREPKPDTSTEIAYVAQVDIDSGVVTMHELDLTAAVDLFEIRDTILTARKFNPSRVIDPHAEIAAAVDAVFPGTVDVTPTAHVDEAWRVYQRARIEVIAEAGALEQLAAIWPQHLPTLGSGDPITLEQGIEIAAVIAEVEKSRELAFPPVAPGVQLVEPRPQVVAYIPPDEGGPVDQEHIDTINTFATSTLAAEAMAWISSIMDACHRSGRDIRLTGNGARPTVRKHAICCALVALAPHADDELTRTLISIATGDELQLAVTLGAAVGSLSIDDADRLHKLAKAIDSLTLTVAYGDDGSVSIVGDTSAAIAA